MDQKADPEEPAFSKTVCGVGEFAEKVWTTHEQVDLPGTGRPKMAFSRQSLHLLFSHVFGASLLPEEGRPPRFQIFFGSADESQLHFKTLTRFQPPIPLNDGEDLRRLAPAANYRSVALWVSERDAPEHLALQCLGIVDLDHLTKSGHVGTFDTRRHVEDFKKENHYLLMKVEGPGDLNAKIPGDPYGFVFRGCKIRPRKYLLKESVFQELFRQIAHNLQCGPNVFELMDGWGGVLDAANLKRHGAAFIILPETHVSSEQLSSNYYIVDGKSADLDLGRAFNEFAHTCSRYWQMVARYQNAGSVSSSGFTELATQANQWLLARRSYYVAQNALADLSSVDGCVVLDGCLKVLRFGAKLQPRDLNLRPLLDNGSKSDVLSEMSGLGMRNGSSCKFCRAHAGVYAFVVSQDSEIRMYWSDADYAYRFFDLDTVE
ncbi:MAG: putative sensor domain DACNV-containing protein [Isosphaeraceae bacterium]